MKMPKIKLQRNLALIGILAMIVIAIAIIELSKPKQTIQQKSDKNIGINIGKLAPDFELESINGKKIRLSDYRGKRVILNFWASWCPPCREEMPEFQNIYEFNKEIVVLGVNLQESKEAILPFINKLGISFPILLDPRAQIKDMYNVFTQPVTYFINENGVILDKKFGALTSNEIYEKIGISKSGSAEKIPKEIKTLPDGTKYIVHPDKLVSGGPAKDGIPSIDNPKFVSVEEANKFLNDNELILGLNLNNENRAYPLQIMLWHEIVNDDIGNIPVAITYCPLCGSGIAFERKINGQVVEFGVSGLLYNSDLIMYDRKTDSLWQQVTGEAIVGELTGMRLKQLPLDTVTWGEWKDMYPSTMVLSRDTGFTRSYGRNPYENYDTSNSIYFPVESEDKRMRTKEIIYGVEINGKFKAYKEEDLKSLKNIEDEVNGAILEITRNRGIVRIKNKLNNVEIIPIRTYWFAWSAFHPDTEIFK